MTASERIGRAAEALRLAGPGLALLYAQTILALVTLRVQSQGLGVAYSTKRVPAFFFYNKALNGAGRDYVKRKEKASKKADRTGTWGEFRQAQGLSSNTVNLTYSGRMFRSLNAIPAGSNGTVFYAALAAADMESADKVEWNITRYGNFLKPTDAEEAEARQAVADEANRIIRRVFQS